MARSDTSYWNKLAHDYQYLGPPLCPCEEDIRLAEQTLDRMRDIHPEETLRVLLCGVTPELGSMRCPRDTRLVALEQTQAMIRAVWPGNRVGERWAVQGNWLQPPAADGVHHVVLSDGCFNAMDYPDGYRSYAAALRRALTPHGLLHARVFVQPAHHEEPRAVIDDLRQCRVPSFHHFKLRLFMAVQQSTQEGLVVADVYDAWAVARIDAVELAAKTGWPQGVVKTITAYQDNPTRLSFPTLTEAREMLGEFFVETAQHELRYPLAERCLSLTLRPRRG